MKNLFFIFFFFSNFFINLNASSAPLMGGAFVKNMVPASSFYPSLYFSGRFFIKYTLNGILFLSIIASGYNLIAGLSSSINFFCTGIGYPFDSNLFKRFPFDSNFVEKFPPFLHKFFNKQYLKYRLIESISYGLIAGVAWLGLQLIK